MAVFSPILYLSGSILSVINPMFATIYFAALLFCRPFERFPTSFPIMSIAMASVLVALIIHKPRKPDDRYIIDKLILGLELYIILAYYILFRWDTVRLHTFFIGRLMVPLFIYLLISRYINSIKKVLIFSYVMVSSALFICLDAIYVHFKIPHDSPVWIAYHPAGTRLAGYGWWANANELAFVSNIGLGFIILIFLVKKGFVSKTCSLVTSAVFFATTFMTGSRAGILHLAVFASILLLFTKRKFLALFAISIILPLLFVMLLKYEPERKDASASSSERIDLIYAARKVFYEFPLFGVGFSRFQEVGGQLQVPHNTYVQAVVELGIIGSSVFFFMLYKCYIGLYKTIKGASALVDRKEMYTLSYVYLATFTSAGAYCIFGNQLLTFPFFTLVGMAVAVPRIFHNISLEVSTDTSIDDQQ